MLASAVSLVLQRFLGEYVESSELGGVAAPPPPTASTSAKAPASCSSAMPPSSPSAAVAAAAEKGGGGLDLRMGVWDGHVCLQNLQLKNSVLDALDLPLKLSYGRIGTLEMQIPWGAVGKEPLRVNLSHLFLVVEPKYEWEEKEAREAKEQRVKQAKLVAAELFAMRKMMGEDGRDADDGGRNFGGAGSRGGGGVGAFVGGLARKWLLESLVKKLLDTIEVHVQEVHIRYEDHVSCASPFSCGITLESLDLHSTAEAGWSVNASGEATGMAADATTSSSASSMASSVASSASASGPSSAEFASGNFMHKVVQINQFSMYWNPIVSSSVDPSTAPFTRRDPNEVEVLMVRTITRNSHHASSRPPHHFILHPVNSTSRIDVNRDPTVHGAQVMVNVSIEQLAISMEDRQSHEMLSLYQNMTSFARMEKYSHFRPTVSVSQDTRAWWLYAYQSVCQDVRTRQKNWSWPQMARRRRNKFIYCELWKRKLVGVDLTGTEAAGNSATTSRRAAGGGRLSPMAHHHHQQQQQPHARRRMRSRNGSHDSAFNENDETMDDLWVRSQTRRNAMAVLGHSQRIQQQQKTQPKQKSQTNSDGSEREEQMWLLQQPYPTLSERNMRQVDQLERELSFEDIMFFRSLAERDLALEDDLRATMLPDRGAAMTALINSGGVASSGGGSGRRGGAASWVGSWLGWGQGTVSAEDRRQLFHVLEYDPQLIFDAGHEHKQVDPDHVLAALHLRIAHGSFTFGLSAPITEGSYRTEAMPFLEFELTDLRIHPLILGDGTRARISVSLQDFEAFEVESSDVVLTTQSIIDMNYNRLVTRRIPGQLLHHHNVPRAGRPVPPAGTHFPHGPPTIHDPSGLPPLIRVEVDVNPPNKQHDFVVSFVAEELEILCCPSAPWLAAMSKFAAMPEEIDYWFELQMNTVNNIQDVRSQLEAKLEFLARTHFNIWLDMDINAPVVIITDQADLAPGNDLLIVDLGRITITTDRLADVALQHAYNESKRKAIDPTWVDEVYDVFQVKVSDVAVYMVPSGEDLHKLLAPTVAHHGMVREQPAWKRAAIVDRFDVNIELQMSAIPWDSSLPPIKAYVRMPELYIHLWQDKMERLTRLFSRLVPQAHGQLHQDYTNQYLQNGNGCDTSSLLLDESFLEESVVSSSIDENEEALFVDAEDHDALADTTGVGVAAPSTGGRSSRRPSRSSTSKRRAASRDSDRWLGSDDNSRQADGDMNDGDPATAAARRNMFATSTATTANMNDSAYSDDYSVGDREGAGVGTAGDAEACDSRLGNHNSSNHHIDNRGASVDLSSGAGRRDNGHYRDEQRVNAAQSSGDDADDDDDNASTASFHSAGTEEDLIDAAENITTLQLAVKQLERQRAKIASDVRLVENVPGQRGRHEQLRKLLMATEDRLHEVKAMYVEALVALDDERHRAGEEDQKGSEPCDLGDSWQLCGLFETLANSSMSTEERGRHPFLSSVYRSLPKFEAPKRNKPLAAVVLEVPMVSVQVFRTLPGDPALPPDMSTTKISREMPEEPQSAAASLRSTANGHRAQSTLSSSSRGRDNNNNNSSSSNNNNSASNDRGDEDDETVSAAAAARTAESKHAAAAAVIDLRLHGISVEAKHHTFNANVKFSLAELDIADRMTAARMQRNAHLAISKPTDPLFTPALIHRRGALPNMLRVTYSVRFGRPIQAAPGSDEISYTAQESEVSVLFDHISLNVEQDTLATLLDIASCALPATKAGAASSGGGTSVAGGSSSLTSSSQRGAAEQQQQQPPGTITAMVKLGSSAVNLCYLGQPFMCGCVWGLDLVSCTSANGVKFAATLQDITVTELGNADEASARHRQAQKNRGWVSSVAAAASGFDPTRVPQSNDVRGQGIAGVGAPGAASGADANEVDTHAHLCHLLRKRRDADVPLLDIKLELENFNAVGVSRFASDSAESTAAAATAARTGTSQSSTSVRRESSSIFASTQQQQQRARSAVPGVDQAGATEDNGVATVTASDPPRLAATVSVAPTEAMFVASAVKRVVEYTTDGPLCTLLAELQYDAATRQANAPRPASAAAGSVGRAAAMDVEYGMHSAAQAARRRNNAAAAAAASLRSQYEKFRALYGAAAVNVNMRVASVSIHLPSQGYGTGLETEFSQTPTHGLGNAHRRDRPPRWQNHPPPNQQHQRYHHHQHQHHQPYAYHHVHHQHHHEGFPVPVAGIVVSTGALSVQTRKEVGARVLSAELSVLGTSIRRGAPQQDVSSPNLILEDVDLRVACKADVAELLCAVSFFGEMDDEVAPIAGLPTMSAVRIESTALPSGPHAAPDVQSPHVTGHVVCLTVALSPVVLRVSESTVSTLTDLWTYNLSLLPTVRYPDFQLLARTLPLGQEPPARAASVPPFGAANAGARAAGGMGATNSTINGDNPVSDTPPVAGASVIATFPAMLLAARLWGFALVLETDKMLPSEMSRPARRGKGDHRNRRGFLPMRTPVLMTRCEMVDVACDLHHALPFHALATGPNASRDLLASAPSTSLNVEVSIGAFNVTDCRPSRGPLSTNQIVCQGVAVRSHQAYASLDASGIFDSSDRWDCERWPLLGSNPESLMRVRTCYGTATNLLSLDAVTRNLRIVVAPDTTHAAVEFVVGLCVEVLESLAESRDLAMATGANNGSGAATQPGLHGRGDSTTASSSGQTSSHGPVNTHETSTHGSVSVSSVSDAGDRTVTTATAQAPHYVPQHPRPASTPLSAADRRGGGAAPAGSSLPGADMGMGMELDMNNLPPPQTAPATGEGAMGSMRDIGSRSALSLGGVGASARYTPVPSVNRPVHDWFKAWQHYTGGGGDDADEDDTNSNSDSTPANVLFGDHQAPPFQARVRMSLRSLQVWLPTDEWDARSTTLVTTLTCGTALHLRNDALQTQTDMFTALRALGAPAGPDLSQTFASTASQGTTPLPGSSPWITTDMRVPECSVFLARSHQPSTRTRSFGPGASAATAATRMGHSPGGTTVHGGGSVGTGFGGTDAAASSPTFPFAHLQEARPTPAASGRSVSSASSSNAGDTPHSALGLDHLLHGAGGSGSAGVPPLAGSQHPRGRDQAEEMALLHSILLPLSITLHHELFVEFPCAAAPLLHMVSVDLGSVECHAHVDSRPMEALLHQTVHKFTALFQRTVPRLIRRLPQRSSGANTDPSMSRGGFASMASMASAASNAPRATAATGATFTAPLPAHRQSMLSVSRVQLVVQAQRLGVSVVNNVHRQSSAIVRAQLANMHCKLQIIPGQILGHVQSTLIADYHNSVLVAWEPLVEPWTSRMHFRKMDPWFAQQQHHPQNNPFGTEQAVGAAPSVDFSVGASVDTQTDFVYDRETQANEAAFSWMAGSADVSIAVSSSEMLNVNLTQPCLSTLLQTAHMLQEVRRRPLEDGSEHVALSWLNNETGLHLRYWTTSSSDRELRNRQLPAGETTYDVPAGAEAPLHLPLHEKETHFDDTTDETAARHLNVLLQRAGAPAWQLPGVRLDGDGCHLFVLPMSITDDLSRPATQEDGGSVFMPATTHAGACTGAQTHWQARAARMSLLSQPGAVCAVCDLHSHDGIKTVSVRSTACFRNETDLTFVVSLFAPRVLATFIQQVGRPRNRRRTRRQQQQQAEEEEQQQQQLQQSQITRDTDDVFVWRSVLLPGEMLSLPMHLCSVLGTLHFAPLPHSELTVTGPLRGSREQHAASVPPAFAPGAASLASHLQRTEQPCQSTAVPLLSFAECGSTDADRYFRRQNEQPQEREEPAAASGGTTAAPPAGRGDGRILLDGYRAVSFVDKSTDSDALRQGKSTAAATTTSAPHLPGPLPAARLQRSASAASAASTTVPDVGTLEHMEDGAGLLAGSALTGTGESTLHCSLHMECRWETAAPSTTGATERAVGDYNRTISLVPPVTISNLLVQGVELEMWAGKPVADNDVERKDATGAEGAGGGARMISGGKRDVDPVISADGGIPLMSECKAHTSIVVDRGAEMQWHACSADDVLWVRMRLHGFEWSRPLQVAAYEDWAASTVAGAGSGAGAGGGPTGIKGVLRQHMQTMDSNGAMLSVCAEVVASHGSRRLALFVPFWVVNASSLDMRLQHDESKLKGKLRPRDVYRLRLNGEDDCAACQPHDASATQRHEATPRRREILDNPAMFPALGPGKGTGTGMGTGTGTGMCTGRWQGRGVADSEAGGQGVAHQDGDAYRRILVASRADEGVLLGDAAPCHGFRDLLPHTSISTRLSVSMSGLRQRQGQLRPIMLGYTSRDEQACFVKLRSGQGSVSQSFRIRENRTEECVLRGSEKYNHYVVGVSTSPADAPFDRTQIVMVFDRYVVFNGLLRDLEIRGSSGVTRVVNSGHECALHGWARGPFMQIRLQEFGWGWSGPFRVVPDTSVQLRLRHEHNNLVLFVSVDLVTAGAGIYVSVRAEPPRLAPYRIENCTLSTLRIRQRLSTDIPALSALTDDRSRTNVTTTILPYHECAYAWDEPLRGDGVLIVERMVHPQRGVSAWEKMGECRLDELQTDAFGKKGRSNTHAAVIADGSTRVLRITSAALWDASRGLAPGSAETQSAMSASSEMTMAPRDPLPRHRRLHAFVQLRGIGLSIIDHEPRELCYASTHGLEVEFVAFRDIHRIRLTVASAQVDNQLPLTPFPNMLRMQPHGIGTAGVGGAGDSGGYLPLVNVECDVQDKDDGVTFVRFLDVRSVPLEVNVDLSLVLKVLAMAKTLMVEWRGPVVAGMSGLVSDQSSYRSNDAGEACSVDLAASLSAPFASSSSAASLVAAAQRHSWSSSATGPPSTSWLSAATLSAASAAAASSGGGLAAATVASGASTDALLSAQRGMRRASGSAVLRREMSVLPQRRLYLRDATVSPLSVSMSVSLGHMQVLDIPLRFEFEGAEMTLPGFTERHTFLPWRDLPMHLSQHYRGKLLWPATHFLQGVMRGLVFASVPVGALIACVLDAPNDVLSCFRRRATAMDLCRALYTTTSRALFYPVTLALAQGLRLSVAPWPYLLDLVAYLARGTAQRMASSWAKLFRNVGRWAHLQGARLWSQVQPYHRAEMIRARPPRQLGNPHIPLQAYSAAAARIAARGAARAAAAAAAAASSVSTGRTGTAPRQLALLPAPPRAPTSPVRPPPAAAGAAGAAGGEGQDHDQDDDEGQPPRIDRALLRAPLDSSLID